MRTFLVQSLSLNGVAVHGLSRISFATAHTPVISQPQAAIGSEDVDRISEDTTFTIETTDVTKVNAILAAAVGVTTFWTRESGAATLHKYTLTNAMVVTGFRLSIPRGGDAVLTVVGSVRYPSGAASLEDVLALLEAQSSPPAIVHPTRLYRPYGGIWTPDAGSEIDPLHIEAVNLSLDAAVAKRSDDDDIGMTAVDVIGWQDLRTSFDFADADKPGALNSTAAAAMLDQGRGVFSCTLSGRGGAADQVLTVNNLLWTGTSHTDQAEHSRFSMNGVSGWFEAPSTTYTINGSPKLFSMA